MPCDPKSCLFCFLYNPYIPFLNCKFFHLLVSCPFFAAFSNNTWHNTYHYWDYNIVNVNEAIILPRSETYSTSLFHRMCFDQHLYIHVHLHSWLGLITSEPKGLTKKFSQGENLFPCNKIIRSCIIMCIDFVAMTCNILYCRTDMYQNWKG